MSKWPKRIVVQWTLEGYGLWGVPDCLPTKLTPDERIYVLIPKRRKKARRAP